ncbi:hypothetical protein K4F52_005792 [Lecanicillium sp. MT-2017a]|nr:hypothetical protein K4F52_005792 [Lecanicillium sp. MT-2017a]
MTKSSTPRVTYADPDEQRGRSGYDEFHAPAMSAKNRTNSFASSVATSASGASSTASRVSSFGLVKQAPTVNVHTTCGRHSDQLLFGGPSLTEIARSIFKKKQ